MSIFIVKIKNNIVGVFDNMDIALNYVYGLLNSNLISNREKVIIYNYKINTSIILFEYIVDLKYNITKKATINYSNLVDDNLYEDESSISSSFVETIKYNVREESSETLSLSSSSSSEDTEVVEERKKMLKTIMENHNKLGQEKINIIHDINMLKKESELQKEKINIYENDLALYYKFKNTRMTNPNFVIPMLFIEKYEIFVKMDNDNDISFDRFIEIYSPTTIKTSYDDLFIDNNDYKATTNNNQSNYNAVLSESSESSELSESSGLSETFSNASNSKLLAAINNSN